MKQPDQIEKLLQDLRSTDANLRKTAVEDLARQAPIEQRTVDALRMLGQMETNMAVRSAARKSYLALTGFALPSNESDSVVPSRNSTPLGRGITLSIAISLIFFGLACILPALGDGLGLGALLGGLFGLLLGLRFADTSLLASWISLGLGAWLANPLLLASIITLSKRHWTFTTLLNLLTLLLAANTFLMIGRPVPNFCIVMCSTPPPLTLQDLHVGFYLWIASTITIGVAAFVLRRQAVR